MSKAFGDVKLPSRIDWMLRNFVSDWERKLYNQDDRECIYDATSVRCRDYRDCAKSMMPTTAIALNVIPIIERSGEMEMEKNWN